MNPIQRSDLKLILIGVFVLLVPFHSVKSEAPEPTKEKIESPCEARGQNKISVLRQQGGKFSECDGSRLMGPERACVGEQIMYKVSQQGEVRKKCDKVSWSVNTKYQGDIDKREDFKLTITPSQTGTLEVTASTGESCCNCECGEAQVTTKIFNVTFNNNTRNGDKVVSARDEGRGLPGGKKKLDVTAKPSGSTAKLKINRTNGQSGSAVFEETGKETRTVTGTETVTILGRAVSDVPRNMEIQGISLDGGSSESSESGIVCNRFEFTVFLVEPDGRISGELSDIVDGQRKLPNSAENAGGSNLVNIYKANANSTERLGHNHDDGEVAFGGIVIRGKIIPSGMNRDDFNLTHSRSKAFNWNRVITGRQFDQNCINQDAGVQFQASEDRSDDLLDGDEDLLPNSDGKPNELFIWVIDVPSTVPARVPNNNDIQRLRKNWTEWSQYAGIQVSKKINWSWASSQKNPNGPQTFVQENSFTRQGDNNVALNHIQLSPNLQQPPDLQIEVTGSTPKNAERNQTVDGKVQGKKFQSANPCEPVVYAIREVFDQPAGEGRRKIISLDNANIQNNNTIRGQYDLTGVNMDETGDYDVKVFLKTFGGTSPDSLTITNP